jgi:hypothetical protein
VTRALALPKGGIVQFRYGENIVDPSTKERICGGSMAGETVVVCFIHWAEDHRNISVVPLRFAILTSARQVGSSIILEMAVDAFAAVGANPNFYDAFRTASEGRAPEHKEGSTEPVGKFAFDVPDKTFEAREADVIVGFENAVKALVQYGVFRQSEDDSANGLFFHVVDLEVRHNWIEFFPPKAVKQTATPFKATSDVVLRARDGSGRTGPTLQSAAEVPRVLTLLCEEWRDAFPATLEAPHHKKLMAVAEFHGRFLKLHPFLDGNGRAARALLMLQCLDLFESVDMTLMDRGTSYMNALKAADSANYKPLTEIISVLVPKQA